MPSTDPATPPVPSGLRYHELQRIGRHGGGRSAIGVILLGAGWLVVGELTLLVTTVIARSFDADVDLDPVTPAGLAWINLAWAAVIPVTIVLVRLLHRLPEGWVASVVGRIRWGWLGLCLGLAVVALVAAVAVSLFLPEQGGAELSGSVNDVTERTWGFVLVILFLTPLQAAGEEYAFRGYLTQAFGGFLRGSPRAVMAAAVVVPAVLFALAHGAQDPPVFVDRLAFGLVAGLLVILTGGLEAGIAMHVLNNFAAFGLALAFGDMDSALRPDDGTWWSLPATLTQSLVYLGLALWVARRAGVRTATAAGVLEPPRGRV